MASKTKAPAAYGARVKALFANVGERARDAREQAAAGGSRLVGFSKDNLEALKESAGIAGSGAKALGQEVVANVRRELAAVSDGPKNLSGVKSCLELARDDTKAFGRHLGKVAGDAAQPLKERVAAVTAKPKAATVKLVKPAEKAAKRAVKSARRKVGAVANDVEQLAA